LTGCDSRHEFNFAREEIRMKKTLLPIYLLAGLAFAAPGAIAQQQLGTPNGTASASQDQTTNEKQRSAMSRNQVKQTLQEAGFKSVKVLDAAYVVQAQTKDGDSVLMYISPPQTSASAGAGQSGQSNPSSSQ
jgi:hypothetical protein